MRVLHVVGARPNFVKAAPVLHALSLKPDVSQTLVHTGQHYDASLSDVFFRQLDIPEPDVNLHAGSGSHAHQTGEIIIRLEPVIQQYKPDWVLVYGDVNSTLAAALVCSKMGVRLAHVEAGLRSFDRTMPEEINRVLTDQVSDLLLTPSKDADENLAREGISRDKIRLVGNVMIDSLIRLLPHATLPVALETPAHFALVTLHRPANVDDPDMLRRIMSVLAWASEQLAIVFPVHPRTRKRLHDLAFSPPAGLRLTDPLSYLEFLALQQRAAVVLTDSGGIQEESTFLGVPCLTLRDNTERPVTVTIGTNTVVGRDPAALRRELQKVLNGEPKRGHIPPLWDGKAGTRIANALTSYGT